MLLVLSVSVLRDMACGTENPSAGPNAPCTRTSDCTGGLSCVGGVCISAGARAEADAGDASASDAGPAD